jgi:FkbM family methyltransferase
MNSANYLYRDMLGLLGDKEVNIVFDVGAYQGGMAIEYLQLFPAAHIHCFEPSPRQLEKLKVRLNGYKNVHIHNYAISNSCGRALFRCNRAGPTDSLLATANGKGQRWCDGNGAAMKTQSCIQVDTITLDAFCENYGIDHIDIIKLDIQGVENLALEGATTLLERCAIDLICAELLFVPLYENQAFFYDVCKMLAQFGYMLFNLYHHRYDEYTPQLKWADGLFIYRGWETGQSKKH